MGRISASAAARRRMALSCCVLAVGSISSSAQVGRASHASLGDTVSVVQLRVPEKARAELHKAIENFANNKLDDSLRHANAALAITPAFPNALTLRGYIELTNTDFEAARADFQHALEVDPNFAVASLYLGAALNRLGRYDEALLHLDRNRALSPQNWEPFFEMAKSWMGKQDNRQTLDAINRASALGADAHVAAAVHFVRGRALFGLHQFSEAKAELNQAVALDRTGSMAGLTREMLASVERQTQLAAR